MPRRNLKPTGAAICFIRLIHHASVYARMFCGNRALPRVEAEQDYDSRRLSELYFRNQIATPGHILLSLASA